MDCAVDDFYPTVVECSEVNPDEASPVDFNCVAAFSKGNESADGDQDSSLNDIGLDSNRYRTGGEDRFDRCVWFDRDVDDGDRVAAVLDSPGDIAEVGDRCVDNLAIGELDLKWAADFEGARFVYVDGQLN